MARIQKESAPRRAAALALLPQGKAIACFMRLPCPASLLLFNPVLRWALIFGNNWRFLGASLNRWNSADQIVPNPNDPQSYNRYSYVLNNALRYVDPSGHRDEIEEGGRTCEESNPLCIDVYWIWTPISPDGPDDPRALELSSVVCIGTRCQQSPDPIIPIYMARENYNPQAKRSAQQLRAAKGLAAAATGAGAGATAISGSTLVAQLIAAGWNGPIPVDDVALAALYSGPIDAYENWVSRAGLILTVSSDLLSGESDINFTSGEFTLGQDTVALLVTTALGEVAGRAGLAGPAFDTAVNVATNAYDLGRLSGSIPTYGVVRYDSRGLYILLLPQ